ncbi:putative transcription factor cys6 [Erysiphe neolycopersici]|uniref:Putative transcription factor cys6 n=1 Tax=Erysiphe neolycopersici TaxID=212602 RepID=A0A420HN65_9PEZI|nr:putative transcription factor cys6 [Erysiphe neolycopersici]
MGFRGKPSKSCHACRQRKTRCDQLKPGCTQCKRANRECPGYRVEGELIFKYETAKVELKWKVKRKNISRSSKNVNNSSSTRETCLSRNYSQRPSMPFFIPDFISPTLEDRAIGLFISNFVNGKNGPSRGHMEFFEDLPKTETLLAAMKAVGYAVCAHRFNAQSMVQRACHQYGIALQLTNRALRDPIDVKEDSTLVGIIVLGIYETIIGQKSDSSTKWIVHFNGASEIIKMRGPDQLKTSVGLGIFVTVCRNLLIAGIQHAVPLPSHLREYMNMALSILQGDTLNPSFKIIHCMMQFGDLRVDSFDKAMCDKDILRRSIELDENLEDITHNHPSTWKYRTLKTDKVSPSIYKGHYHIYSDLRIAQVWNMLRTLRIMINQMIYDVLNRLVSEYNDPKYLSQRSKASKTLCELQHDILCSVPQFIGVFSSKNAREISHNERGFRVPMSGTWYLCHPLWLAALLHNSSQEIKDFAVYNLRNISRIGGIREGDSLADSIESSNMTYQKPPNYYDRIQTIARTDVHCEESLLTDGVYQFEDIKDVTGFA